MKASHYQLGIKSKKKRARTLLSLLLYWVSNWERDAFFLTHSLSFGVCGYGVLTAKEFLMKRATGGEIIQVDGGHILRSTGRKDRHSKVYTSKGPRDRRVRLSAHTAIQFYDVQDRLGYDRPSKAVDWLIKKAKNVIDQLAELPPLNPNDQDVANNLPTRTEVDVGSSGNIGLEPQEPLSNSSSRLLFQRQLAENPSRSSSYMMSEPVAETQSVANTSKSFFPLNSGTSLTNFLSFPHDIVMSRDSIQVDDQDLGLSLHTNLQHDQNSSPSPNILSFEATYDNNNSRIANWIIPHQPFFSQGDTFSQIREPLQSSFSQLIHHAWEQKLMASEEHQSSMSNNHFNGDFQFPPRIHGEEVNGVVCIKPSFGSSSSHH